jgi:crotonobetainyl-CoA:carnitine CoA-transferase CaiB-like acyl-CoA transferase
MSGIAALQGHNGEAGPEYVNTIIADKAAGLTAAYAIAMALYERERSGLGQAIEVPMFETIVSFTLLEHMAGATFVPAEHAMGYERVLSPNRKPYRTKDGYIGLLPYTTAQWQRFFRRPAKPPSLPTRAFPIRRSGAKTSTRSMRSSPASSRPGPRASGSSSSRTRTCR